MAAMITPKTHDILLGRGKTYQNHEGNQRFRAIIAVHIPKYADKQTTRDEKTRIVESIVEDIYQGGCSFLKQELPSCVWFEIGYQKVKDKVGHALRDATAEMHRSFKRAELMNSQRRSMAFESRVAFDPQPAENHTVHHTPMIEESVATSDGSCGSDFSGLFSTLEDHSVADIEPISLAKIALLSQPQIGYEQAFNDDEIYYAITGDTLANDEADFFSSLLGMLDEASNVLRDSP